MKLYKDRVNRDVLKYSFANRVPENYQKRLLVHKFIQKENRQTSMRKVGGN